MSRQPAFGTKIYDSRLIMLWTIYDSRPIMLWTIYDSRPIMLWIIYDSRPIMTRSYLGNLYDLYGAIIWSDCDRPGGETRVVKSWISSYKCQFLLYKPWARTVKDFGVFENRTTKTLTDPIK